MDWKKIGVLFLFAMIGIFIAGFISRYMYVSILTLIFILSYLIYLVYLYNCSKRSWVAILIIIIYLLLILTPFPVCRSSGWGIRSKDCTCIGIEKAITGITDISRSECIGFQTDKRCFSIDPDSKEEIEVRCIG